ncbi:MAG: hypothetical protein ABI298_05615 [Acidimicrobiales bacterium]
MWNTGLTDWGPGNSVVVLAVIGVYLSSLRLARQSSRFRSATVPLFFALFVIAARQLMAYGESPSAWHWSFITHVVGWGLWIVLVASAIGIVVSMRGRFVPRSPDRTMRGSEERERSDAPKVQRSTNFLCALIVLTIAVAAFSQATWLNMEEVTGRILRLTIRGDSNYGPGTITVVVGLELILVCVGQLCSPHRRSPVAPSALVFANLVTLANFYVAEANPPFVHGEILFRVEWGYVATVGATLLSLIVLVGWWRIEHTSRLDTTP